MAPFLDWLASRGISCQFGTNEPAEFLAAHGWSAHLHGSDAVPRKFGRWPPPGVPEDAAARATAASRNFFISAERLSGVQ